MTRKEKIVWGITVIAAGIALYAGWRVFRFFCDDAYISFRYISNSMFGYGYVWNPPPFRPVEGYTNFLWIVILEMVWRVTGVQPPGSSLYASLIFSYLTLLTASLMIIRLGWTDSLKRFRILLMILVLAGTLTNRTFLAWTSSGLETALYNFLLVLWVYCCLFMSPGKPIWLFAVSGSSSALYLTRPDGFLFLLATVLILIITLIRRNKKNEFRHFIYVIPVIAFPIHLGWRKYIYGEWLPNTYYVKVSGIWPESGIRYAGSFILEYGLWLWFLVLTVLVFRSVVRFAASPKRALNRNGSDTGDVPGRIIAVIVTVSILAHAVYYICVVGGDHFEYRVFSHLVFLMFISFVWMMNRLGLRPVPAVVLMMIFILGSYPVPWTHWYLTKNLSTRAETHVMIVPVAEYFPAPVRPYAEWFDVLQTWLIKHHVCMRHQEHKIFFQSRINQWPSREEGLNLPADHYPVIPLNAVGYPGWVLPKINIIDMYGLNDYVIARMPERPKQFRAMGHDKTAPRGYAACFLPNTERTGSGRIIIMERGTPLDDDQIRNCEQQWADRVKTMRR